MLTNREGWIFLSPKLETHCLLPVFDHECVHAFFTPLAETALGRFRVSAREWGYHHVSLLRYLEETTAETYSQFRAGGPLNQAVWSGIKFPLHSSTAKQVYQIRFWPGFSELDGARRFQLGIPLEGATLAGTWYLGYRAGHELGIAAPQSASAQTRTSRTPASAPHAGSRFNRPAGAR